MGRGTTTLSQCSTTNQLSKMFLISVERLYVMPSCKAATAIFLFMDQLPQERHLLCKDLQEISSDLTTSTGTPFLICMQKCQNQLWREKEHRLFARVPIQQPQLSLKNPFSCSQTSVQKISGSFQESSTISTPWKDSPCYHQHVNSTWATWKSTMIQWQICLISRWTSKTGSNCTLLSTKSVRLMLWRRIIWKESMLKT